jgi:hypothetical protein
MTPLESASLCFFLKGCLPCSLFAWHSLSVVLMKQSLLILSCLVLSCLVLSCLVLSCRVVSCRGVAWRGVAWRGVACCVLPYLALPWLGLSCCLAIPFLSFVRFYTDRGVLEVPLLATLDPCKELSYVSNGLLTTVFIQRYSYNGFLSRLAVSLQAS